MTFQIFSTSTTSFRSARRAARMIVVGLVPITILVGHRVLVPQVEAVLRAMKDSCSRRLAWLERICATQSRLGGASCVATA